MNAKQLMLGDYVRYNGKIARVTILSEKVSEAIATAEEGNANADDVLPDGDKKLKPLNITGSALKRAGFEYDELDETFSWQEGDNLKGITAEVRLAQDDKGWVAYIFGPNCDMEIEEFKLSYVHELQHIMRCVGIKKEITL